MTIVGLDMHQASFTLAVLTPQGKVACVRSDKTSARTLIQRMDEIVGPKTVVVEESHLAQWVKRTLERRVDHVLICDPRHNGLIAKANFADDRTSAEKLARLCYGKYLKEVWHPGDEGAALRALFLQYHDQARQLTRFKNKLKAVFRQEAIPTGGAAIYEEEAHSEWLRKLKGLVHHQHRARQHFEVIDLLARQKAETSAKMVPLARKSPAFKWLDGMPGAGPILTAGYIALIDTPHRFSKENKLWSYAGLGNRQRISAEVMYADHASPLGCRPLKWVVIEHFLHAVEISRDQNRFQRLYERLRRQGLCSDAARRQVCRALLSTVRALWLKGEAYRDDPLK